MLYKTTLSAGYTEQPHIFPLDMHDYGMIKAATEMHPDVLQYIQKVKPIPGKSIILVDAMGAGEFWGSNVNGDYFGEDQLSHEGLDYGYKTFEHYAYPYLEHMNEASIKDPHRRVGDKVQLAVYFHPMHRVQLVVVISKTDPRTSDIVRRIDSGEYPDVSMACGVQYDQCSYCGSKHKTRRDYCTHARNMLNKVMDDGQKIYLINHKPRFHDISMVFIGAEKNSKVLLKVASINKRINAEVTDVASTPEKFDKKTLERLSKYNIEDVMHGMRSRGFNMSPEDFQYMVLHSTGQEKKASILADSGVCFDPRQANETRVPQGVQNPLVDMLIDQRPMYKYASNMMIKSATQSIVAPVLAGLYHAFNYTLPNAIISGVQQVKRENLGAAALGYMMGHNIAGNLIAQPTIQPFAGMYSDPGLIPDYSNPYTPAIDFSKMAAVVSPWRNLWNTVKGAAGTIYDHPIIAGGLVGTAAYKLSNDAEKSTGISTGQPLIQALKYGGGLTGSMLLAKYLKTKGLRTP